jgi:hypothetical protein
MSNGGSALSIIPFAPSHTEEITFEIPSNAELII